MRRSGLLISLLLMLLVTGFSQLLAQDEVALITVLQVVETDPLTGQEARLSDPFTIFFDRDLDCTTAEAAFSISPDVAGTLDCTGSRLTFTPDDAYQRATTYTITLSTDLTASSGVQLLDPYTVGFTTTGYLMVTETFPTAQSVEVETTTAITVIFNRPVVPLGVSSDQDSLPDPLTIEPAVSGSGEWLNTSIYVFEPETALAGGTTYSVTVNPPLDAVDGSILQNPFSWSFSTQSPLITQTIPEAGATGVALDQMLQVTFNQPMDRASVESSFYLRLDVDADIPDVSGTFDWNDNDTGFSFTPDDEFFLNSLYQAGFNPGAMAAGGTAGLIGTTSWSFASVPAPAITGTDPFDGQQDASPFGGFTIYFASRMDVDTLQDKITVDPAPVREPEYFYRDWSESYSVSFPTEAGTTYMVSIEPGMADIYGNTIQTPFTFSYTTSNFTPDVALQVPGSVGFYNAYRDPTDLFLTHRNVSRVDLQLYDVPVFDFLGQLAGDNYYNPAREFVPQASNLQRQWQIQSVAPENARRYERVTPGLNEGGSTESPDAAVSCDGALPTRLQVGDMAIVVTDPDPVRARREPPSGEIVDLLYRGYQLPVVGGPVCTDNTLLWWQVRLRDEQTVWVAESVAGEYMLDVSVPAAGTPRVDPPVQNPDGSGRLPVGIYFLTASAPETAQQGIDPQQHFMVVATANLTVKATVDTVTVWATDVQSGAPLAGVPLVIYDSNLTEVARGTTDAQGILTVNTPRVSDLYVRRMAILDDGTNFGLGFTEWTDGVEPWQFQQNYQFYPSQYRVYIYTDRPVYRPGQPVYFRGIVRNKDDVSYTPPDPGTVPVQIFDNQGNIVFDDTVSLSRFGTFNGQFELTGDAPLGYYMLEVQLPSASEYGREGGSVGFNVAEYRLPEFQVQVIPEETEVVQGDTINVDVNSTYFFGGAVSDATVDYSVRAEPYAFQYDGDGFYSFVDLSVDESPYFGGFHSVGDGSTTSDESGTAELEIAAELEDSTRSQTFVIEAIVRDESNQSVAGRTDVVVHQGLIYAGVRPVSYVSTAGQDSTIEIITVDWDSEPVPGQSVDVEIIKRQWSSVQEQDASGRTTWTWEVEEIPVTESSITTDDSGEAVFSFVPEDGGIYQATVRTRDEAGNDIVASTTIWVAGTNYVSWRQQNSNRIDLIADQEDYQVGDTAEILITSPFQGSSEALITVERGDVLSIERVTMDSNSYVYELPIVADYSPNVFVSVLIVKGVDENNPVAAFRMGLVNLTVDVSQRELNIDISTTVDRAQPQETVTYTVQTTDYQGEPVEAEVGVNLTDLASLSLMEPNVGPMLPFFFGEQGLSVRTASVLTINTDQLTQETLDTIKGGGGGGGGGGGPLEIRGEFIDTPYWNASLVTDADGTATFDVTLPDNLTTWRLDARALTAAPDGDMLVGQETFDLISTRPLIIRPVTPRFFVVDDEVYLSAVVNNNTSEDLEITVSIDDTDGLIFMDESAAQQTVNVAAADRVRVTWQVRVADVEAVKPIFTVVSSDEDYADGSISPVSLDDDGTLPVYRYSVPETVGTAGVLRTTDSRAEAIVLPQRFDVSQGELTVRVDQSLARTTLDGLDYLENYPHQCIEQTVSRFLPNIVTFRALNSLGLADATLESNLNSAVNVGLQKLYAEQKSDGGWGWFVQDESNPLTTAYALIGLVEARDQGFTISGDALIRAQGFLQSQFIVPSADVSTWAVNRQAFMLYALARSGAPDVSRTVTLFDNRMNMSLYAKAFLADTLYIIDGGPSARTDALMNELVNAAITGATGIHWQEDNRDYRNWNTDTRTTAIVLDTLLTLMPDSDLLPGVVRYLVTQRQADAWETTQETAWAVMALTDWMVASGELQPDYAYSVSLNDTSLIEGNATPATVFETEELVVDVADLLRDEANILLFERTGSDAGALYYTAHLKAYLPVPDVESLDRGILLSRSYDIMNDDDDTPVTEARAGDLVQVRLTIVVPEDRHYVVIEDPLPAGAEAINPDLATSQQIGTRPGLDNSDPLSRGWGWWWFSNIEFRDEKVVLYSTYLPAGTYEYVYSMRPGIEGAFNVIPATGQEFYFPEVYGRSAGSTFTVLPADE